MSKNSTIHLGIVGACGRGSSFKAACNALPQVCIRAVCDVDAGGLPAAAERLGATDQYTDYDDMLERSTLDAVILATPLKPWRPCNKTYTSSEKCRPPCRSKNAGR